MGIIPEVTCSRCQRKYSSLRGKCPYCGARKETDSGRTPAETGAAQEGTPARARADANLKWQMIFGGLLVAAIILAVIVLISFGIRDKEPEATPSPTMSTETPVMTPTPTPPPTPAPTVAVTGLSISHFLNQVEDITLRTDSADNPLTLTATIFPAEAGGAEISWSTSDDSILTVEPAEDGKTAVVTSVSAGTAYVYVSAGGIESQVIVRIPG